MILKNPVERLLYLALLASFIGMVLAIYLAISFGHKLNKQLKDNAAHAAQNAQIVQQEVKAVEEQHRVQDDYLTCLIALFTHDQAVATSQLASCTQPFESATKAIPAPAPISTPTPVPAQSPAPARKSLVRSLVDTIREILP